jgi:hypothetical protein
MTTTHSDNHSQKEYYALQPISVNDVDYLLKANIRIGAEYSYLHDNWSRETYNSRDEVIDDLIEAIYWLSDGNQDIIYKKIKGSEIFRKWDGGIKDIDDRFEYYDQRKSSHYSRYPEEYESREDKDSDVSTGSEGQVHRERAKSRSRVILQTV